MAPWEHTSDDWRECAPCQEFARRAVPVVKDYLADDPARPFDLEPEGAA